MNRWFSRQQVAQRFNVSAKTISRWENDSELGFPAPEVIRNRNYFSEAQIAAFAAAPKGRRATFKRTFNRRFVYIRPAWLPHASASPREWRAFFDRLAHESYEEEFGEAA